MLTELDCHREVAAVRVNGRTMAPLNVTQDIVKALYQALRKLLDLVYRAEAGIQFRLDVDDTVIFDNHRMRRTSNNTFELTPGQASGVSRLAIVRHTA